MRSFRADLTALLIYFTIAALAIIGWVKNIIAIVGSDGTLTGMLIGRVIGVFVAPIGAILGWM